jgi:hypothetical protein
MAKNTKKNSLDSNKAARDRYIRANIKVVTVPCNINNEADIKIIEKLSNVTNKTDYIRQLVSNDIRLNR